MFASPLYADFRKDWLLHLSGFVTWSVICYLSIENLNFGNEFFLQLTAFIVFYLLFVWIIFFKNNGKSIFKLVLLGLEVVTLLFLMSFGKTTAPVLLVLFATQLPTMFTRKQALLLMFLVSFAHFCLIYNGNFFSPFFEVMIFFMLQVFGFSAIETAEREAQAKKELAAINQELLATRFMLKTNSEKKERLRISRDLHDVIGHQLTALSLNLEVAKHKVSEEFKPLLDDNLQLAKVVLTDVRHVVKEMRALEQFDLVSSLESIIDQLPHCQLRVMSSTDINSLELKQQLMFCLQEGISNALRHGKANLFTFTGEKVDNNLMIELSDNGSANIASSHTGFGSGLTGMKERLIDFTGEVALMANENGCTLRIDVQDCYD